LYVLSFQGMKFNKEQKYSVTTVKSVNTEHKHVHIDVRHGQDSQNITCFINTFCVLKVWNEQN
jgi:hypothetical protein